MKTALTFAFAALFVPTFAHAASLACEAGDFTERVPPTKFQFDFVNPPEERLSAGEFQPQNAPGTSVLVSRGHDDLTLTIVKQGERSVFAATSLDLPAAPGAKMTLGTGTLPHEGVWVVCTVE